MNAKDLMIGDWVAITEPDDFHGYIGKVIIINAETNYITVHIPNMHLHDIFVEDLQPIPLTEEILEKNGFVFYHDVFDGIYPMVSIIYSDYKLLVDDGKYINGGEHNDIKYVHELQHALRLCKIEKEIIL